MISELFSFIFDIISTSIAIGILVLIVFGIIKIVQAFKKFYTSEPEEVCEKYSIWDDEEINEIEKEMTEEEKNNCGASNFYLDLMGDRDCSNYNYTTYSFIPSYEEDNLQKKIEENKYMYEQWKLDHQDPSVNDKRYGAVRKDRYGNLYDGAGGVIDKTAIELKKQQKEMQRLEERRKSEERRIRNQEYYWGKK